MPETMEASHFSVEDANGRGVQGGGSSAMEAGPRQYQIWIHTNPTARQFTGLHTSSRRQERHTVRNRQRPSSLSTSTGTGANTRVSVSSASTSYPGMGVRIMQHWT